MRQAQQRQARRPPRQRHATRPAPALLATLAAAVLAAALVAAPAAAQVLPLDKQALLEFKAGLTEQGGELLFNWVPESDPCDGWTGVRCTCNDFFVGPEDTTRAKVRLELVAGAGAWFAVDALSSCHRRIACAVLLHCCRCCRCWARFAWWPLVACCNPLQAAQTLAAAACTAGMQVCQQPDTITDGSRVLQLNFGDPQVTNVRCMTSCR